MSIGDLRQIIVSNETTFDANIYIVTGNQTVYPLHPQLKARDTNIVFDLNKVPGLSNGDTIQAKVVSSHGASDNDTLLTYTKKSENQAIYAIAGTINAPTVTFQSLETIIPGPPPPHVRQITISNKAVFDARVYVIQGAGAAYPLSPELEAGDTNIVFDLTKVQGLKNGDTIKARVESGHSGKHTDNTLLTYTKKSDSEAIYTIAGTVNTPAIAFQKTAIIHEDSPPDVCQIIVSNKTTFDAGIYVVTGAGEAYALSPQLQAGNKNIVFDLGKVQGLRSGDTFHARVVSGHGALFTDQKLLRYTKKSETEAIYAVAGSAKAPTIAFQRVSSMFAAAESK
ncbi:hypothetical protein C8J56DRAFT_1029909 [Mycena floridula]|nr:hypothetical protein C8J56DRAFT_1030369 [Mycena floridula]KAJ7580344.1 hypothetical protein C8J56DRAFT_1029909 [Mycena floridula]